MASTTQHGGIAQTVLLALLRWWVIGLSGILLALSFTACESSVGLIPVPAQTTLNPNQYPDFNFLASSADTIPAQTLVPLALYVRQKTDKPVTAIIYRVSYSVNGGDGQLIIPGDTLRPGDVGRIPYSAFKDFVATAQYRSLRTGAQQTVTLFCSDTDTRQRQATVAFVIRR